MVKIATDLNLTLVWYNEGNMTLLPPEQKERGH